MSIYEEAVASLPELIQHRRFFHKNAEIGFNLPKTIQYVKDTLINYGLKPYIPSKGAIAADIGTGDKTFLLRADLDALPMEEMNNLEFKSVTDNAHNCGHDLHIAMLLGAAKILKKHEKELKQKVRLLFQPDEEGVKGAKSVVDSGFMTPDIKASLALHVSSVMESGKIYYYKGSMYASSDVIHIKINGKSAHAAAPHESVDPINVAFHIYQAMQGIIARECPAREFAVLSIGQIQAGHIFNVIPEEVFMAGTLRTYNKEVRKFVKERLKEIIPLIAKTWRAKAEIEFVNEAPSVYCDPTLTEEISSELKEDFPKNMVEPQKEPFCWSEDFGAFGAFAPQLMLTLGAQVGNHTAPIHDARVLFNEDSLASGAAALAIAALKTTL